jgi:hypothetical protein
MLRVVAENVLLGKCCAWLHMPSLTSLQVPSGPNDMIMGTGIIDWVLKDVIFIIRHLLGE